MPKNAKLVALRGRLVEAQEKLLMQAADAGALPSDKQLAKIADLEAAIAAVEHMLDDKA
ncbi:hypothetical protein [Prosthecomicrobium pneumaticum]|uniref:Uncharacterized protein n=1 Tax=Prosthecomicrobium pneumaticum TaxID=81895 RepID=A0A7W9FJP1_9HYPH|nr:hypothetical protein [Prosthecomicrobium pneumaticum]MBB5751932.1 hypothetical protein [Prosthecomicrobium pneumaticum]